MMEYWVRFQLNSNVYISIDFFIRGNQEIFLEYLIHLQNRKILKYILEMNVTEIAMVPGHKFVSLNGLLSFIKFLEGLDFYFL